MAARAGLSRADVDLSRATTAPGHAVTELSHADPDSDPPQCSLGPFRPVTQQVTRATRSMP